MLNRLDRFDFKYFSCRSHSFSLLCSLIQNDFRKEIFQRDLFFRQAVYAFGEETEDQSYALW